VATTILENIKDREAGFQEMYHIMTGLDFQDEKNRIWLAEYFYKKIPQEVINYLQIFKITDTKWLHQILNDALSKRLFVPDQHGGYDYHHEKIRLGNFQLDAETDEGKRIDYAKSVLDQNPAVFMNEFEKFDITDTSVKESFFHKHFQCRTVSWGNISSFKPQKI
jgi:hypothetical protein